MSLSMSQNKSGLGTGQRWRAGECQPRAERRRSLRPGGGQGERRGGSEGGLCQLHRKEGFLHQSHPLLSPPVTACYQGAGSSPEEGRKLPSVMRLWNLTRWAQFHVLSEDTPPFPLASQHLTWSHHSEMASLTRSFLPWNSTHTV